MSHIQHTNAYNIESSPKKYFIGSHNKMSWALIRKKDLDIAGGLMSRTLCMKDCLFYVIITESFLKCIYNMDVEVDICRAF